MSGSASVPATARIASRKRSSSCFAMFGMLKTQRKSISMQLLRPPRILQAARVNSSGRESSDDWPPEATSYKWPLHGGEWVDNRRAVDIGRTNAGADAESG